MTGSRDTIRVVIPLTIRKRNGRPKILPPEDAGMASGRAQDPHVLRAIARAWNWRRKLERGDHSTIRDISAAERVTDQFISRMIRLAYLSPAVLEALVITRTSPALSIYDLAAAAERPWAEQMDVVVAASREYAISVQKSPLTRSGIP
jgi:hypothetical protein